MAKRRRPKQHRNATMTRNATLACVAQNDPGRFRTRTVQPERGAGRKDRPRNSNRAAQVWGGWDAT